MENQTYLPTVYNFKENLQHTPAQTDEVYSRRHSILIIFVHLANLLIVSSIVFIIFEIALILLKNVIPIDETLKEALTNLLSYIAMIVVILPFTFTLINRDIKISLKKVYFTILITIGFYILMMLIVDLYTKFIETNIFNLLTHFNIVSEETVKSIITETEQDSITSINQSSILDYFKNPYAIAIASPMLVIFGPFYEELVYRKAMFRLLNFKKPILNILISGFIFGSIHVAQSIILIISFMSIKESGYTYENIIIECVFFFNYFLSGILLGTIYTLTGYNIVPVFIVHLLNNLTVLIKELSKIY